MFLQLCAKVLHHPNHNSCPGFRETLTVYPFIFFFQRNGFLFKPLNSGQAYKGF